MVKYDGTIPSKVGRAGGGNGVGPGAGETIYFEIVLSTEKQQAFLEMRKDQHSGERAFDYWISSLSVRNKCNSLVCSETEGCFSFPFMDILSSVSTSCPHILFFFLH